MRARKLRDWFADYGYTVLLAPKYGRIETARVLVLEILLGHNAWGSQGGKFDIMPFGIFVMVFWHLGFWKMTFDICIFTKVNIYTVKGGTWHPTLNREKMTFWHLALKNNILTFRAPPPVGAPGWIIHNMARWRNLRRFVVLQTDWLYSGLFLVAKTVGSRGTMPFQGWQRGRLQVNYIVKATGLWRRILRSPCGRRKGWLHGCLLAPRLELVANI